VILLDTSGLLAALDASQHRHSEAAAILKAAAPPLLLSPFVLAELDYLVAARVGQAARTSLLAEVERGAYALAPMSAGDVGRARTVIERHADLGISLADASIVVLAERHQTFDVLTLDQRRFRVLSAGGKPLRVLPADGLSVRGALAASTHSVAKPIVKPPECHAPP
jgi:uncharacterized protein